MPTTITGAVAVAATVVGGRSSSLFSEVRQKILGSFKQGAVVLFLALLHQYLGASKPPEK